jgi:hypothetical protein
MFSALMALPAGPGSRSPRAPKPDDAICLLDVPVHKTGTAFTKPVDPIVGQAIAAWQAVRPAQPPRLDRRPASRPTCCSPSARTRSPRPTSTRRSSRRCAPRPADVCGNITSHITSHRARSTIAHAAGPLTLDPAASELILPVRDPAAPSEPVRFEPAGHAPPLPVTAEAESRPEREVRFFPQNNEWHLVVNPSYAGTAVFPDGLRKSEHARETYPIRSADPLSAVASSDWQITLSRPGRDVEIAAHGRMTADAETFHTAHTVRDSLDGATVSERSWQTDIPRRPA